MQVQRVKMCQVRMLEKGEMVRIILMFLVLHSEKMVGLLVVDDEVLILQMEVQHQVEKEVDEMVQVVVVAQQTG